MFQRKVKETEAGGSAENGKKQRKPISPKKKKLLIAAGILVTIFVAIIILSQVLPGKSAQPGLPVTTGTAEVMDLEQAVSIKGTIKGSESADVASALNYKIVSILVHEGDIVKKDQVLAVLDADTLQNDYAKAASALEVSRFDYESSKQLYEEGAISKEDFLKAQSTYESDRNTLDSLNVSDKTNIKSPISGTVTRVNVNIGRYANDTENKLPMFVVENLSKLKMDVKISEYDISKIKVGQKVIITAEMLGDQSVEGTVSRISPTGEKKDETSKEMVIPVQIDVDKGDTNLIAGVTAKAKIEIEKKSNVLTVPIDAVLEDPDTGDNYVFLYKGGTLKKVPVELGIEGDFNIEITSGKLSKGNQVVLNPTFEMKDGMKAAVLPQQ